jgi:SAM-dependent methyltransferase
VIGSERLIATSSLGGISTVTDLVLDGERIIPEEIRQTAVMRTFLSNHLRRYRLAERYVVGRRVLDAACGAGYGSAMLRRVSGRAVVAVDNSIEALRYPFRSLWLAL